MKTLFLRVINRIRVIQGLPPIDVYPASRGGRGDVCGCRCEECQHCDSHHVQPEPQSWDCECERWRDGATWCPYHRVSKPA